MSSPSQVNPQILLDLSTPFDQQKVDALDTVIKAMFNSTDDQTRHYAHNLLETFKNLPDAWRFVNIILSNSNNSDTKYFALKILENCIQTRWKILPPSEREGIKQYVSRMTLELATNEAVCNNQRHFINKVNDNFIQIVKHEWPGNWPDFISEVCMSAGMNVCICENNIRLLTLLSEEVFDFGNEKLKSKQVKEMMNNFTQQFQLIFDLCINIFKTYLQNTYTTKHTLVQLTIKCLSHFLKWIPYGYIFQEFSINNKQVTLLDLLLEHFWEPMSFRVDCMKCFTEISSLCLEDEEMRDCTPHLSRFFSKFVQTLSNIPQNTLHYTDTSKVIGQMRQTWELFYRHLALLLTAFLRNHRETICETPENSQNLFTVLNMLVKITDINDDETFKICLDYWYIFLHSLIEELHKKFEELPLDEKLNYIHPEMKNHPRIDEKISFGTYNEPLEHPELLHTKIATYTPVIMYLLKVLIFKMAKPQEVYIQFDQETEEVTRENEVDTDEVALYNQMRSVLVLITNLIQIEASKIILDNLTVECSMNVNLSSQWNPTTLNRLCYSIGGISGAMNEVRESQFLISSLKLLLLLCDKKKNKPAKAVVASCIMHVVGQYSRFLKANFNLLIIIINKLFEFMHETFPGVQDMACEAFLKIAYKCKSVLAAPKQVDKHSCFLEKLLYEHSEYCKELDDKQVLLFFEACGHIISSSSNKSGWIDKFMNNTNIIWSNILDNAQHNNEIIYTKETARQLLKIIRINTRIAKTNGVHFTNQLRKIFQQMLIVFYSYSHRIASKVVEKGPNITKHIEIKVLSLVKRETLHLVEEFISRSASENQNLSSTIYEQIIGPILMSFLEDYSKNVPATRDHEVLSLLSVFMHHIGNHLIPVIPVIFSYVFDTTLEMIKLDFQSYPDHREKFYLMLKMCNQHCFEGLFSLPPEKLQTYVEALVWAFKHELPQIAEQGLELTFEFLQKMTAYNLIILQDFCDLFYYNLMKEILAVLTDRLHRSGFKYQTMIFRLLLQFIELKLVNRKETGLQKPFVINNLVELLVRSFETVNKQQVETFVLDLFNYCADEDTLRFQSHIRDFLISLNEFAGNNFELYEIDRLDALKRAEENEKKRDRTIPGMLAQFENLSSVRDFEDS